MPLERVRSSGYAFQVEMAYVACLLGYTFQEKPFYFADRNLGRSKMSFQISLEAAIRVWQMRFDYRDLNNRDFINRS
jgi:dolichol-phosphate mannosyltransferase